MTTYEDLLSRWPWRSIRNCPGRHVLASDEDIKNLFGLVEVGMHHSPVASDPVHLVILSGGGGVLSYARPDGRYVHTLNTAEGQYRKLRQLGIDVG